MLSRELGCFNLSKIFIFKKYRQQETCVNISKIHNLSLLVSEYFSLNTDLSLFIDPVRLPIVVLFVDFEIFLVGPFSS